MRLFNCILAISIVGFSFFSCKKDKKKATPEEEVAVAIFQNGALIVNEGLFQQNNSTMSWVNFATDEVNNQIFEQKTNRQLGDTGNDIGRYGSKVYVIVNVSSTIEVLNAQSGIPIKQIPMVENGIPKQPRYIEFHNGKAFVPCFDGFVDVIDTVTLEVIQRIAVGANPDGIHKANNQLYVANSGGLSYPNVDSTLSVIDPNSLTETHRIVVGKNPTRVISDNNGDLYVITQTGLNTWNSQLVKVNHQTLTIDTIFNWQVNRMVKLQNDILLYISSISQPNNPAIKLFNPQTQNIVNHNFIDANLFTTFYGAQYDAVRNQIYCFDAMSYVNSGFLRVFSANGTHLKNYPIGLNPSKLVLYD